MPVYSLMHFAGGRWPEEFHVGPHQVDFTAPLPWSISQRTLRGGLCDGVELLTVDNGRLSFSVLPGRGMGLWKGRCGDVPLGWNAPVLGPVHPKYVNQADRGGLGWLTGFDEWLCRCGLNWNGPPGDDEGRPLTLHGRIANSPAHHVEVHVDDDPPRITVRGIVEEGGLFYSRLRLTTTYVTELGTTTLSINDEVANCGGTPTEFQLLYHLNNGPPLLEAGSRVYVPVDEMWPMTAHAADGLDRWTEYGPPTAGFAEQVYCLRPRADDEGRTLALLANATADRAIIVRWRPAELPCFTVWKNSAAVDDGYVTGLEPATNFPRFRARERAAGRVLTLAPGQKWSSTWSIELTQDADQTAAVVAEVARLQSALPKIHREPLAG